MYKLRFMEKFVCTESEQLAAPQLKHTFQLGGGAFTADRTHEPLLCETYGLSCPSDICLIQKPWVLASAATVIFAPFSCHRTTKTRCKCLGESLSHAELLSVDFCSNGVMYQPPCLCTIKKRCKRWGESSVLTHRQRVFWLLA